VIADGFGSLFLRALDLTSLGFLPLIALAPLGVLVARTTPAPRSRVLILSLPLLWVWTLVLIAGVVFVPPHLGRAYLGAIFVVPFVQFVAHIGSFFAEGRAYPRVAWAALNLFFGARASASASLPSDGIALILEGGRHVISPRATERSIGSP